MPPEPAVKRAIAFFDGQNLFHSSREAFGYSYPNYDPFRLAERIVKDNGWRLSQVRFYSGVPAHGTDQFWNRFWMRKLSTMGRRGVISFTRELKVRTDSVLLADGSTHTFSTRQEKGIDVRIALDVVRLALDSKYDVAVLFSQDQDLSEVADEIRAISQLQRRWIKIASAFPVGGGATNARGIRGTTWIGIDQATYDSCIDPNDYR